MHLCHKYSFHPWLYSLLLFILTGNYSLSIITVLSHRAVIIGHNLLLLSMFDWPMQCCYRWNCLFVGVTAKRRILPGTYTLKSRTNKKRFVSFARWSVLSVVLRVGHCETKALNWPEVKAKDSASRNRFFFFLMRCKNAMECSKYQAWTAWYHTKAHTLKLQLTVAKHLEPLSRSYHSLKFKVCMRTQ